MTAQDIQVLHQKDLPQNKTVLVFSPHPDDTAICAGGAVAMLARFNRVFSVVMTTGHRAEIPGLDKQKRIALREKESRKEGGLLGIQTLFLRLSLYDTGRTEKKDGDTLTKLFEQYRPDILILPNLKDPHPTHHSCAHLVMKITQKWLKIHSTSLEIWHYESPWSLFDRDDFNRLVSIPPSVFQKKLEAIQAHSSQNRRTPYDVIAKSLAQIRSAITAEQHLTGFGQNAIQIDPYAELFSVVQMGSGAALVETLSGIRGVFRKGLTPEIAYNYGYAYGCWLKKTLDVNPKVVVGMDTRPSGFILKKEIMAGLNRAHCHIFDIGVGTTPMVQFEVRNRKCHGGIMITASHNEPHWNGFKFFWKDGGAITPEQMQSVIEGYHAETKELETPYVDHYIHFLQEWIGEKTIQKIRKTKLKLVVDPNGGSIIVPLRKLLNLLGIERVELNMEHGIFNHPIEPSKHSLVHMGPIIRKHRADFGVAWDCDGDRIEIIFPNGELLSGHSILALVANQLLRKTGGSKKVVVNAGTSGVISALCKKWGGQILETDVGESNVAGLMKKSGALLGGEGGSGGCILPPSRCRDGLMTLLKILEAMVERKKTITQLLKELPHYYTRQCNLTIDPDKTEQLRTGIIQHFEKATHQIFGGTRGSLKLRWEDGSFLFLRESKTEPNLLRLVVDSPHRKRTDKIFEEATTWLQQWGNPVHKS